MIGVELNPGPEHIGAGTSEEEEEREEYVSDSDDDQEWSLRTCMRCGAFPCSAPLCVECMHDIDLVMAYLASHADEPRPPEEMLLRPHGWPCLVCHRFEQHGHPPLRQLGDVCEACQRLMHDQTSLLREGVEPNPGPGAGRGRGRGRGRGGFVDKNHRNQPHWRAKGGGRQAHRDQAIAQAIADEHEEHLGRMDAHFAPRVWAPLPALPPLSPPPPPPSSLHLPLPRLPAAPPPPLPPYGLRHQCRVAMAKYRDAMDAADRMAQRNRRLLLPSPPREVMRDPAVRAVAAVHVDVLDLAARDVAPKDTAKHDVQVAKALIESVGQADPTDIPGLGLPIIDNPIGCGQRLREWLERIFCCAIGFGVPHVVRHAHELDHLGDTRTVDDLGTPSLRPNAHNYVVVFPTPKWCVVPVCTNWDDLQQYERKNVVSATLFADLQRLSRTAGAVDVSSALQRSMRLGIDLKDITLDARSDRAILAQSRSDMCDQSSVAYATVAYFRAWHKANVEPLFPNMTA